MELMENGTQQPQEIPQIPEVPQEQISQPQGSKFPKFLVIALAIIGILIAGYFVSAKREARSH